VYFRERESESRNKLRWRKKRDESDRDRQTYTHIHKHTHIHTHTDSKQEKMRFFFTLKFWPFSPQKCLKNEDIISKDSLLALIHSTDICSWSFVLRPCAGLMLWRQVHEGCITLKNTLIFFGRTLPELLKKDEVPQHFAAGNSMATPRAQCCQSDEASSLWPRTSSLPLSTAGC
jgi:hypothetical protein